jgi:hypothetical protein
MTTPYNNSLDRSAGSSFFKLSFAFKVGCFSRTRSTQTFGVSLTNMRISLKVLLGLVTLLPLIYALLFFLGLLEAFYVSLFRGSWDALMYRWVSFPTLFRINMFVIAWNVILAVIYLIHVATNARLKTEPKIMWAALIIAGSLFSMVAYWYLIIWREHVSGDAVS